MVLAQQVNNLQWLCIKTASEGTEMESDMNHHLMEGVDGVEGVEGGGWRER